MRQRHFLLVITVLLAVSTMLCGCYHKKQPYATAAVDTTEVGKEQHDSLVFAQTHHYSQNFNFIIKADSLVLVKEQPEEYVSGLPTDTLLLTRGQRVAVADIRIMPSDPVDSVWVQLARDQYTFGWIREANMLPAVVPDDPISKFISTFSDTHLLISLIIISVISVAYMLRNLFRRKAKIVIFNDINSFYPTLLTLTVATSATFYASMQLFAASTWHNFYFHPTLNPFSVTPLLAIFLASVWSMLIISIAALDEVRRLLPFGDAILYLCGLCGICAICYIIFSITTLYYIGYILWTAYIFFALFRYWRYSRCSFLCGNCGAQLHRKGRCPYCGTWND